MVYEDWLQQSNFTFPAIRSRGGEKTASDETIDLHDEFRSLWNAGHARDWFKKNQSFRTRRNSRVFWFFVLRNATFERVAEICATYGSRACHRFHLSARDAGDANVLEAAEAGLRYYLTTVRFRGAPIARDPRNRNRVRYLYSSGRDDVFYRRLAPFYKSLQAALEFRIRKAAARIPAGAGDVSEEERYSSQNAKFAISSSSTNALDLIHNEIANRLYRTDFPDDLANAGLAFLALEDRSKFVFSLHLHYSRQGQRRVSHRKLTELVFSHAGDLPGSLYATDLEQMFPGLTALKQPERHMADCLARAGSELFQRRRQSEGDLLRRIRSAASCADFHEYFEPAGVSHG